MQLQFVIVGDPAFRSFDPIESDHISSAVVMEQLVGNLVKEVHGNTGQSEPYLAEKWSVSEDGKEWSFVLRSGLKCEDGSVIDSFAIARSMKRTLKRNLLTHDVPVFNQLRGWKDFASGPADNLSGILSPSALEIKLSFETRPQGLLEFLAMPQFGYHCDSNFDLTSKTWQWKDRSKIISSGPYRLSSVDEAGNAVLEKRQNWIAGNPKAPSRISYQTLPWEKAKNLSSQHTIVLLRNVDESKNLSGFHVVHGMPINLSAIVLSPYKESLFKEVENRRTFRNLLRAAQSKVPSTKSSSVFGESFYLNTSVARKEYADSGNALSSKTELLITGVPDKPSADTAYVRDLMLEVFSKNSIPHRFVSLDRTDKSYLERESSNREFDIRLARVDIGGNAENWVIKMMFCSKLGISFPDPSGRICELANEFEKDPGKLSDSEYLDRFNSIIEEDCAVIPMYHSGLSWLFSEDIELESISSNLVVPRIEKIGLK
ncbi:ABC transporter substrate-binding protein [Bdellovibrionota bacterium FG-2]